MAHAEPPHVPVQRVVTTRERALAGLESVLKAVSSDAKDNSLAAARTPGPDGAEPWWPVRNLCLRAGDRISRVNGVETPDASTLHTAIQSTMETLKANPDALLAIDVLKENRTRRLVFRFQEFEVIHKEVTFPVGVLRLMLQEGIPFIEREAARCRQYLGRAANFFGSPDDDLDGIQIDNTGGPVGAQLLDVWGIGIGDQILTINGIPMKSFDAVLEAVHDLQKNIESGANRPLVIEIERGLYRRIVQTIKLE